VAEAMVVAGVMSGTSADGVDVALCRISGGVGGVPRVKVLGYVGFRYSKAVRAAVLTAMEGGATTTAELSRLHWRLGAIYAECVEKAAAKFGVKVGLVGCHGQTVYHEAAPLGAPGHEAAPLGARGHEAALERPAGARMRTADSSASLRNDKQKAVGTDNLASLRNDKRKAVPSTWQMGEASVIAERLRVPVVSDFRPADMAAGGQGAPLVPMLDYCMFRSAKVNRVLQNLGGIGNLTAIPAGAGVDGVMAFDTGPGNMVIDACMARLFGKAYDRGGVVGRRGRVLKGVVDGVLREGYFSALPPKSCGREEFGASFVDRFIALCRKAGGSDADVVVTATALTAASVVDAYRRFVWGHLGAHRGARAPLAKTEFVVAGGGVKNATLMRMLREGLEPLGVRVRTIAELGVDAQAKEAVAFALLGWMTWNGMPGNVVSATGAGRTVVLGKVTYG
jgi:anhydro-N-acetylmuramic acid kinase